MKLIVKKFNNLIQKTIFKVQNKTTIFKHKNKINNQFIISSFNKYLIAFISLIFFYLFYLLIPILYDKAWVQNKIESKFFNEFKINLSSSADISYRILPSPHYLIKNSKILLNNIESQKPIADIKNLKIFLSQNNFFDKEKINFKKVIINNANFSLIGSDIKILNEFSNNQFSNKKIKINNSNIFFKNNLDETIAIIKVDKAILFYDNEKLLNLFNLKGKIFNIPFVFGLENKVDSMKNAKINLKAKSLKLNILNVSTNKNNNFMTGKNIISFLNSTFKTKYKIKEKLITFESRNSKTIKSKINYSGELSINPFDLNLNFNMDNYKISQLFNYNPIIIEIFKSKLLFNENISVNTSLAINSNKKDEIFNNAKINFHIINGKINLNNSRFVNDNIGILELNKSNLFLENNNLILKTNVLIKINNSSRLYSLLNTAKKSRKKIENILINLDYDFLSNQIKFNIVKIDNNEVSEQFLTEIQSFSDNNINNLIKSRRLLNKLLNIYDG